MSIISKSIHFVKKNQRLILIVLASLLTVSLVFIIGVEVGAKVFKRPPLIIQSELLDLSTYEAEPIEVAAATSGIYVASKNGQYYYLPECSGVSRIKEENKVWFQTKEEAEAKGFKPSTTCFK